MRINGKAYWLWRAVDSKGQEIDILLQPRRSARCAYRFFRKILDKVSDFQPRVIVTDKLHSYRKPIKFFWPKADHRSHKGLNNRAENSHQITREKERQMRKFHHPKRTQTFLSARGRLLNLLKIKRYSKSSDHFKSAFASASKIFDSVISQDTFI